MDNEKIAIVVDSCTDIPIEYRIKYHINVLPMTIVFKDKEYTDGVDLSEEELFVKIEKEVPKTSMPSPGLALATFKRLRLEGYNKVLVVAVSSALSGTYNMFMQMAQEVSGMEIYVVDTKSIGIGAGFSAIYAGDLIEKCYKFEEICDLVELSAKRTKIYFCVSTLEYLRKGGRIGLLQSFIGTALNLKPIISCNEDGVYYNAAKARGRENSLKKAIFMAAEEAAEASRYNVAIMHAGAKEEAKKLVKKVKSLFPNCNILIQGQITTALTVHTGKGLIGVCVQKM